MSNTNVKIKASPSRSPSVGSSSTDNSPVGSSSMNGPSTGNLSARNNDIAMKTASMPDGDKTKHAKKNDSSTSDDAVKSKSSTFDGLIKKVQPYFDKHGHAVVYGIVGIVAAILILTIGFFPVLLLAIFAAIGIAIGKFRDSGISMQSAARSLTENLRR